MNKNNGRALKGSPIISNNCKADESLTVKRYENYVPIDYMRLETINFDNQLILNSPLLEFCIPVNKRTGEIKLKERAVYNGLVFQYYEHSDKMYISGSLHKFFNKGAHNYDDFTIIDFFDSISQLYELFSIKPHQLKINQIEWGVNFIPPIPTNELLTSCLSYKGKRIREVKKNCFEVGTTPLIKFYNKSHMYNLDYNLMRYEMKHNHWGKYCKKHQINRSLKSLIDSKFIGMKDKLLQSWIEMIMLDPTIKGRTNDPIFLKYSNPSFWTNLNSKRRHYHKKKLIEYNNKFGGHLQGKIKKSMCTKLSLLNSLD